MKKDETCERLKAWFSAEFLNGNYSDTVGGCETCGYGGIEVMTLAGIRETIDGFFKEAKHVS